MRIALGQINPTVGDLAGNRDLMTRETLSNYEGLLQRCPELRELQARIVQALRACCNGS